jgi:hypothetical protein
MLAHSPPLPLVVDYDYEDSDMNAEDEIGLILTLEQRDRVRRIRLKMDIENLQRLFMAINEGYPILEYLIIVSRDKPQGLALPETFQVPHLHHLALSGFALPIGSRLLTTAVRLITLVLVMTIPSTYFEPNALLKWISFMPQLETLVIHFLFAVPSRTIETQLTLIPIITPITLPNLRLFSFQGIEAYLEAIVCRMATPCLERLQVFFFEQLTFSVPHLLQFMNTTEGLRFSNAGLCFSSDGVDVVTCPHKEADLSQCLLIHIPSWHLDWQVSSAAQICTSLNPIFSAVEHLALEYEDHSQSSEEHNEVDRTEWRRILRSFSNVKTLCIKDGLDKEITRCLELDDGELALDVLPELHELTYSRNRDTDNEFASFINARENAGRPITVVDQAKAYVESSSEATTITSARSEACNDFDT